MAAKTEIQCCWITSSRERLRYIDILLVRLKNTHVY